MLNSFQHLYVISNEREKSGIMLNRNHIPLHPIFTKGVFLPFLWNKGRGRGMGSHAHPVISVNVKKSGSMLNPGSLTATRIRDDNQDSNHQRSRREGRDDNASGSILFLSFMVQ